jgi:hypothetical protein
MSTPSKPKSAVGKESIPEQQPEVSSIAWKREYKGRMVTIFGSPRAGYNAQIDKQEPMMLGLTRAKAIKHAKDLIDEEQAKYHSKSAGGNLHNGKSSPGFKDPSFPTTISADRRRG